jgi:hypothetical protein
MADSNVEITARCSPPAEKGKFLLPREAQNIKKKRVLVSGANGRTVLKPGRRADAGVGACVSADLVTTLGGEDAQVSYRPLGFLGALWRDGTLRLGLAVAVLTFFSTAGSFVVSFVKNSTDDSDLIVILAPFVALFAFASAAAKLWKDYNDL